MFHKLVPLDLENILFVHNLIHNSTLVNDELILNKIRDVFNKNICIKDHIFKTGLIFKQPVNFKVVFGDSVTSDTPII